MPIDQTSLTHCIEDIKREIAEEYPHLTLIILPYTGEKTLETIEAHCAPRAKSAGIAALKSALQNTLKPGKDNTHLAGLTIGKYKSFIPFLAKPYSAAAIWLKIDTINTREDASIEIYRQLWVILKLEADIKALNVSAYQEKSGVFTPKTFEIETARANMLADTFAAIMMALSGQEDALKSLAKIRCEQSFDRTVLLEAENHPFPIALDAAILAFNDLKAIAGAPIYRAIKITEEIDLTTDDTIIRQWQAFITPAQDMLLSGLDIRNIMGAAIYTSEDAYNRSTAYLICDILDTEPAPTTQFESYNPFADTDAQERVHNKAREAHFQHILERQEQSITHDAAMKAAHKQCWALINGNPIGWCAPAWVITAQAIKEGIKKGEKSPQDIFHEACENIDWLHVRTLHRNLLTYRRQGKLPTLSTIAEFLRQEDDLRNMAVGIKDLIDIFEE